MKFLDINLASDPVRNYSPFYWTYGILSAAILVFLTYNVFSFTRYSGELERLKQENRQSAFRLDAIREKNRRHRKEIQNWDFDRMAMQAGFAGNAILRRTFSWTELFNQLEEVMPPQVMLQAIRPNISADGITIRIDGVAKGSPAILELLETLQSSSNFRDVYPGTERKDSGGMMTFNLTFEYIPPVPVVETAAVEAAAVEAGGADSVEPAGSDAGDAESASTGSGETSGPEAEPAASPGTGTEPVHPQTGGPESEAGPEGASGAGTGPEGDIEPGAGEEPAVEPEPEKPNLELPGNLRKGRRGRRPPPRPAQPAAASPEPADAGSGPVEFLLQGETVSEVYRRLARIGKVSIVLEEGLNPGQRLTARIQADDFDAALQKIADLAGHILVKEGEGLYRVADAANPPESMLPAPVDESDLPAGDEGQGQDAAPEKEEDPR